MSLESRFSVGGLVFTVSVLLCNILIDLFRLLVSGGRVETRTVLLVSGFFPSLSVINVCLLFLTCVIIYYRTRIISCSNFLFFSIVFIIVLNFIDNTSFIVCYYYFIIAVWIRVFDLEASMYILYIVVLSSYFTDSFVTKSMIFSFAVLSFSSLPSVRLIDRERVNNWIRVVLHSKGLFQLVPLLSSLLNAVLLSMRFLEIFSNFMRPLISLLDSMTLGGKRKVSVRGTHFSVVSNDYEYNRRLLEKESLRLGREPLRRLKGRTDVYYKGVMIHFDYPIVEGNAFDSWLNSSYRTLSDVIDASRKETCDYVHLVRFCLNWRYLDRFTMRLSDYSELLEFLSGRLAIMMFAGMALWYAVNRYIADPHLLFFSRLFLNGFGSFMLMVPIAFFNDIVHVESSMGHYLPVFVSAFLEEVHKFYFPYALPSYEFLARASNFVAMDWAQVVGSFCALAMHLFVNWHLSFWDGVMFHAFYNLCVFMYEPSSTHFSASMKFSDSELVVVTRTVQLLLQLQAKDMVNFSLSIVNFGYADELLSFFNFSSLTILMDYFAAAFSSDEPLSEVSVLTGMKGSQVFRLVGSFLPESVRKSPTWVAVFTFIVGMFGVFSQLKLEEVVEFLPSNISGVGVTALDLASVVSETFVSLFKSLYECYRTGDLKNFLRAPRHYVLRTQASELIEMTLLTKEDNKEFEEKAVALIAKLNYSSDMDLLNLASALSKKISDINNSEASANWRTRAFGLLNAEDGGGSVGTMLWLERLRDHTEEHLAHRTENIHILGKLYDKIKEIHASFRAVENRDPPEGVLSLGEPGTGKTTLTNSLINRFFKKLGIERDNRLVAYVDISLKHPAETANPDAVILVLNDIAGDHSKNKLTGQMSLVQFLQMVFDSTPLTLPAASIMNKLRVFTKVQFVIMNSNFYSFAAEEDVKKLERRFRTYISVIHVQLIGPDRIPIDSASMAYKKLSSEQISSYTMVTLKDISVDRTRFNFEVKKGSTVHLSEFLEYFSMRLIAKEFRDDYTRQINESVCKCGAAYVAHYKDMSWSPLTSECPTEPVALPSNPCCTCGLLKEHPLMPICRNVCMAYKSRKPETTTEELASGFVETVGFLSILYLIWCTVSDGMERFKLVCEYVDSRTSALTCKALSSLEKVDFVLSTPNRTKLKFLARYHRIVHFIKVHYTIFLSSAVASGAMLYWIRSAGNEATGKVILRDNTNLDSMVLKSFTQEPTYPQPVAEEWKKSVADLMTVQVQKRSVGQVDLGNHIDANTFEMVCGWSSTVSLRGYVSRIKSNIFLVNTHYLYENGRFMSPIMSVKGTVSRIGECDCESYFHEGVRTDLSLVRLSLTLPGSGLYDYFPKEIGVNQITVRVRTPGRFHESIATFSKAPIDSQPSVRQLTWSIEDPQAQLGECGSLAESDVKDGSFIVGTVCFRSVREILRVKTVHKQGGMVVLQSMLDDMLERLNSKEPVVECISLAYQDTSPLSINSAFREVTSPYLMPIGGTGESPTKFQSEMKPTKLHPQCSVDWSQPYGIIKKTRGQKPDGNWGSAFSKTMSAISKQGVVDSDRLRECTDRYVDYMIEGIEKEVGKDFILSPLTLEQAFFGDMRQGVDRVNFSSSIGEEDKHWRTRAGMFSEDECNTYCLDPKFRNRMQEVIDGMGVGVVKGPTVCGKEKDEIRSQAKLDEFAVRLFYTVDIYSNTLARMYLLPIIQVLMKHPQFSKCFGKLNSGSKEWDELFKYLENGDYVLDLDFKNFDISHDSRLIREIAYLFYRLAQRWYRNQAACLLVYCLVFALVLQLFKHQGDIALKLKGLPSGHIVTLILNSLINILLMMVAFKELYPEKDFFEYVFPATVGDDNVSGVKKEVAEKFNLVNLQRKYDLMGYIVTDASKSAEVQPFTTFDKAQFVKRRFRYEPLLKRYVAPLEKDSIYKMLAFAPSKGVGNTSVDDRMVACLDVAQREMFFHGRVEFDRFRKIYRPLVEEIGWSVHWYDFEELVSKWKEDDSKFMHWI